MTNSEQELRQFFRLYIDKFLEGIEEKDSPMVLTMYDRVEQFHLVGGYSTKFGHIYTEKDIDELRNMPLEMPLDSVMDYALKKMKDNGTVFRRSVYRINCETGDIYETELDEQNQFIKYDQQLPKNISIGRYQKAFVKTTIDKLGGIERANCKQYLFSAYIYHSETRYIVFLSLFSSIHPSDENAKELYRKTIDFLLRFAPFMVFYKYKMDSDSAIRISDSYKRLAYVIKHEENGFAQSVDGFLRQLLRNYTDIQKDREMNNLLNRIAFKSKNMTQFNSELGGDDPLRRVDQSIVYKSGANIIDEAKVTIDYLRNTHKDLNIEHSFSRAATDNPQVSLSRYIFRRVLKHLVNNSKQIGARRDIINKKVKLDIDIECEQEKRVLVIQVIDNCGGFEDEKLLGEITYDKFISYLLNRYSRASYERGGGWLTILRYVEATSGSMLVENYDSNGKGAIVTLRIPL